MVKGLHELMDIDNSDAEDSLATAFFHESAENGKTDHLPKKISRTLVTLLPIFLSMIMTRNF